jgi:hypothetical protein
MWRVDSRSGSDRVASREGHRDGEGLMRRFSVVSLVAAAVLVASAISAAKPSHAAVTLGSDLATEPDTAVSGGPPGETRGVLFIQDVLSGRELVSPFDGVIVRWRVRLGDQTEAQAIRLRVVRRLNATQFTVISSGTLESVPAGAGTYTFPAQLPIRSGDQLGAEEDWRRTIEWMRLDLEANLFTKLPSPPDGGITDAFSGAPQEGTFNADVEPDADNDGFGDETQDQCRGQAGSANGCPPTTTTGQREAQIKKCKKKYKGKAKAKKRKKCIKKAKKLPV